MPRPSTELNLSAPEFVLSLLDSAPNVEIRVASLVAAAAAFDIDSRAVRVALARLAKQGILNALERGVYRAGRRGHGVQQAVASWATAEATLKPWDGQWLAVYQGQLKRTDKTAVRARERALRMKGFQAIDAGLAVRPANLRADLANVHAELVDLGLDPDGRLLVIAEAQPGVEFGSLWDREALEARYRQHLSAMAGSTAAIAKQDAVSAARETLLVGRAVTRDIVLDPLLPKQLVDTGLRQRMITAMKRYDRLGKRCWRTFYTAIQR